MKRLRGLSAQIVLLIILPLFLILSAVALGSVAIHQSSMREMVGERDLRAVRAAAAGLSGPLLAQDQPRAQAMLSELLTSPETTVMIVDRSGCALYSRETGCNSQYLQHPGVADALAGRSGTIYHVDQPGGQEHVVAYAPVAGTPGQPPGWALVVEEPWGEMTSPWLRTSLVAPLALVPAVALSLLAIWLGVQRIIRPLQKLDKEVTALGWGDFDAISAPVGGIEEIKELQSELARMAVQVRSYQQSMRGYLGAVTAAQEDERKRLARELHDDTVQSLIALKQRVQVARRKMTRDPAGLDSQLAELQEMIETTMDEVRRFSRALRPIYLEEAGLVAALETLARDVGRGGSDRQVQAVCEVTGEPRRLPAETELALYRIVQEATNNAIKHSRASRIRVHTQFTGQDLRICVEDNGIGFPPPERVSDLAESGHYGLMGMQERAQLAGAQLTIQSEAGSGTKVEVRLPF